MFGDRRISPERLTQRLEQKGGTALIPPTETMKTLAQVSDEALKERYTKRYGIYRDLLLKRKSGESLTAEEQSWLRAMNNLNEYIGHEKESTDRTLRDRQMTVFEDIYTYFETGEKEGYVKLPTGVGKTVIFVELAEAMNVRTLILVPTKELVTQTEEKFAKFAAGMDVGLHYSLRKDIGKMVTITTYDSFINGTKDGTFRSSDYELLILDEVHEALSKERSPAVEDFGDMFKIGFSATPDYSERKSARKLLGKEIHSMEIREAIQDGLLCGVSVIVAETDIDLSSVPVQNDGSYRERDYQKALNNAKFTQACVELYQKGFASEHALAFCAGVAHAKDLAKAFQSAGISAEAIYGGMNDDLRSEIIARYRKGEIRILTNDKVLIAGLDVPETSVCFNLAGTESFVRAPQRGGRVTRLDDNKPDKVATIVEFVHKDNRNHKQVLYSQILEGALVLPTGFEQKFPENRRKEIGAKSNISIEGITIVVDTEEVMRITKTILPETKTEIAKLPWNEFVTAIRSLKITGAPQYQILQRSHPDWPTGPDKYSQYKDYWISWPNLLGYEIVKKLSWSEFIAEVKLNKVKDSIHYQEIRKNHPEWPAAPEKTYKTNWKSWPDLCGKEVIEKLSWDNFNNAMRANNIRDSIHYQEIRKNHPEWPAAPEKTYKNDWKSWPALFGREIVRKLEPPKIRETLEIPPWSDFVQQLKILKIQNASQYAAARKQHPNWPASPIRHYPQWTSWYLIQKN